VRGSRGSEVEALQNALIKQGFMTEEQKATGPGIFGPQTQAALKAFQRAHGLEADGKFGPLTQHAMTQGPSVEKRKLEKEISQVGQAGPASTAPVGPKEIPDSQLKGTRSLEEQAKLYDKYEKLIPADKMKSGPNEMNIVGMRHHDIENSKDLRKYDDRFIVLYKDESGQKHVKVFEGATHTGQTSTKGNFTDVNKDGKADIAYVKPGTYDFHLGRNEKFGDHLRPDSKIAAWRDTNQDGRITDGEKNTDYTASAILFHKGGSNAPRSVGCQTLEPNEYERFIDLIKQDANKKVSYTLVDASKG
jgi:peptidoglycan hydrolase-like protein with peptidoglycan-binding domain